MNIHLHNVDLFSTSGPNCFGRKLYDSLKSEITFDTTRAADASLVFIETNDEIKSPIFQRLDGIYFNSEQDYKAQNKNILETYKKATGVIFQSSFNRDLTFRYFGDHKNYKIIHNGADLKLINSIPIMKSGIFSKYDKVWCCASSWRPHKRLEDNINYFLQFSGPNDVLLVAGAVKDKPKEDSRIKYLGNLDYISLLKIYKSSDYFIHLAWLDHCPNVVVDARASGCKIICSSSGGTKEIAGAGAIIIDEQEWNFEPIALYVPPKIDFSARLKDYHISEYDMEHVGKKYLDFIARNI